MRRRRTFLCFHRRETAGDQEGGVCRSGSDVGDQLLVALGLEPGGAVSEQASAETSAAGLGPDGRAAQGGPPSRRVQSQSHCAQRSLARRRGHVVEHEDTAAAEELATHFIGDARSPQQMPQDGEVGCACPAGEKN